MVVGNIACDTVDDTIEDEVVSVVAVGDGACDAVNDENTEFAFSFAVVDGGARVLVT